LGKTTPSFLPLTDNMAKYIFLLFSYLLLSASYTKAGERQFMILFDFNKSDIPDSSMIRLVKIIAGSKIDSVLIEGHCDSVGSKEYNYILSQKRANEVRKLLTQNGIDQKVIKTCTGYGKDQPLTANSSATERQLNRRVVVHFTTQEQTKDVIHPTQSLKKEDLKVGNKIVLKNMLFYGARHTLKPESKSVIENLCDIMRKNPTLKIEIQGHVCCTTFEPDGFDIETQTENLSVTRAAMVYHYLIDQCHIDAKRLKYRGFGGTQKIIQNDFTEAQQQVNRRVEIMILEE